ncbi:MAG TPA: hypothetical protein VHU79_02745 [Sphingomicrobium sp.]|nr:hypothetical protein [Sphingomicrobium sp.]
MIDEIYDRHYQSGRDQLNGAMVTGLMRLGRSIATAFAVLNRIEYDAPWKVKAERVRCNWS